MSKFELPSTNEVFSEREFWAGQTELAAQDPHLREQCYKRLASPFYASTVGESKLKSVLSNIQYDYGLTDEELDYTVGICTSDVDRELPENV